MGRRKGFNLPKTVIGILEKHYPIVIRLTDIENSVNPTYRPKIWSVLNKLVKQKKVQKEKTKPNNKESYYRLKLF